MTTPFFSICIPNFNYSKYLRLTIESVLQQTFQDFEIIVSDNASTDDSVAMVKSFIDPRITVVKNRLNLGFTPNLDKATENAKGAYMILLSSDDIMLQGALQVYNDLIKANDGEELVLMSACAVINSKGEKIGSKRAMTGDVLEYLNKNNIWPFKKDPLENIEYYNSKDILRGLLTGTFQPAGQFLATCYSTTLYKKLEGYRSIMAVHPDANFSHRLLFENPKIIYVNNELFAYRIHIQNNLSATLNMSNIKHLTDGYLLSKQYDAGQLAKIGLKSEDLEIAFINNIIFRDAFWALLRGNIMKGIRLLAFGVASYPQRVLWNLKFPFLNLMVFFSPLLGLFYKLIIILIGKK
jgi:glycosyltransferase involved in cell wall biosynthesis